MLDDTPWQWLRQHGLAVFLAVVAIVSEGVPVSVYEMVEGGTWYKVGLTGYIYHELLKPSP